MKIGSLLVLLAFAGAVPVARADVIFSGSVSTSLQGGTPCSNSGSGSGTLALACSSTATGASASALVGGTGDQLSGVIHADSSVSGSPLSEPGIAVSSIQFVLNGNYVLTGGTGTTTANFLVGTVVPFTTSNTCEFVFNGAAAQDCRAEQTISETVQYGVPFSIGLNASIYAKASNGAPSDGELIYNFNQIGGRGTLEPSSATPEPSSVLLLMPGMLGAVFAGRRRAMGLARKG